MASTHALSTAAPVLEPSTQRFIDALTAAGGPPLYTLTPNAAREVLASAQRQPVAKLPASIEDTTFSVGPTGSVRIRIVRPDGAKGTLPAVMHFHGGGWILGDKETHDRMTREIAVGANAAVVFVDYDRAPEAEYPVAIEQAYAATKYVAEHGTELGIDPARLAVIGDSVGGNMAAAVTLIAKEEGGPRIAFQVLFYPLPTPTLRPDHTTASPRVPGSPGPAWNGSGTPIYPKSRLGSSPLPLHLTLPSTSSKACPMPSLSSTRTMYSAMRGKPMPVSCLRLGCASPACDITGPSTISYSSTR